MTSGHDGVGQDEIAALHAKFDELERVVVLSNDAMCALTHILFRMVVDAGLATRDEVADAIAERAAPIDRDDHNPILFAFSRAIRMNLPGGRFDMIEGGRSAPIDPETN